MKDSQKGTRIGKEAGQTDPAGSFPGWRRRLASKSGEDGEGWQAASPAGGGGWASKSGEDGEGQQAASSAGGGGWASKSGKDGEGRQAVFSAGGGGWASKSGEDGEGWQAASPAGCGGLPLIVARMVRNGRQLPHLA